MADLECTSHIDHFKPLLLRIEFYTLDHHKPHDKKEHGNDEENFCNRAEAQRPLFLLFTVYFVKKICFFVKNRAGNPEAKAYENEYEGEIHKNHLICLCRPGCIKICIIKPASKNSNHAMPDLIRHPVFLWIPAFSGMTALRYLIAR
jgi:hypothetical protein